jgi:hypothetical protein
MAAKVVLFRLHLHNLQIFDFSLVTRSIKLYLYAYATIYVRTAWIMSFFSAPRLRCHCFYWLFVRCLLGHFSPQCELMALLSTANGLRTSRRSVTRKQTNDFVDGLVIAVRSVRSGVSLDPPLVAGLPCFRNLCCGFCYRR